MQQKNKNKKSSASFLLDEASPRLIFSRFDFVLETAIICPIVNQPERSASGARIEERRLQGTTFAKALVIAGRESERDISQIPTGPEIYFGKVRILEFSGDGLHALGQGEDEDSLSLLRDGKPLFGGRYTAFEVLRSLPDYSRLIVKAQARNGKQSAFIILDDETVCAVENEEHLQLVSPGTNIDQVTLKSCDQWATYFDRFRFEDGKIQHTDLFKVKGRLTVGDAVVSSDGSMIVWKGYTRKHEFVFQNGNLLAKGNEAYFRTNPDFSKVLTVVEDRNKTKIKIWSGGVGESFEIKGRFGRVAATEDLELVCTSIKTKKKSLDDTHLVVSNSGGNDLVGPFDRISWLEQEKDRIVATVERNGVRREIVVTRDQEPQESEAAVQSNQTP